MLKAVMAQDKLWFTSFFVPLHWQILKDTTAIFIPTVSVSLLELNLPPGL